MIGMMGDRVPCALLSSNMGEAKEMRSHPYKSTVTLQAPNFLEDTNQLFLSPLDYFWIPFLFIQNLGC